MIAQSGVSFVDQWFGAYWLVLVVKAAVVLVFFAIDTARNAPETFVAIVVITGLAVVLDLLWKLARPD